VELLGGRELEALGRRCRWVGFAGDVVGSGLLIQDLGRPSRFLNMLRMFRPTSPMNVGAWILSVSGALNSIGVGALLLERRASAPRKLRAGISRLAGSARRGGGALEVVGTGASVAAGILGLPLAGYTAVLLSNTAVPVWQRARRTLPFLFMASGTASAAGLLQLLPEHSERERRVVRRFGILGKVGELAAELAVERELSRAEELSRPLEQGRAGTLWKAARLCTAASLALDLLPGRQRWKQVASGVLGTAGALATRYAIYDAGKVSTKDPHATFVPQRQGLGAAEVTGNTVASDGKPLKFPLPVIS
jgi:hypothetical protein